MDIWEAAVGEELDCKREPSNNVDRYAVAVVKGDIVVGHLPKKLARIYSLFIRRGGVIRCRVAGSAMQHVRGLVKFSTRKKFAG